MSLIAEARGVVADIREDRNYLSHEATADLLTRLAAALTTAQARIADAERLIERFALHVTDERIPDESFVAVKLRAGSFRAARAFLTPPPATETGQTT
jgi:hypothetical protein